MDALKECLNLRLIQRLREDEGGVYTPSVSVTTTKYPDGRYLFEVQFGCAPQNVDKLIASANNEVEKLRTIGPLQENLDKWRAEDRTSRETALKNNGYWMNYLVMQLKNDDSLQEIDSYNELRDGVTTDQVKDIADKYLSGKNYIKLVLLPEKTKAPK